MTFKRQGPYDFDYGLMQLFRAPDKRMHSIIVVNVQTLPRNSVQAGKKGEENSNERILSSDACDRGHEAVAAARAHAR